MMYDATYHRSERMRALERWSQSGVLQRRRRLPIEEAFAERVARSSDFFFKPVPIRDSESVVYHRQVSYLVDAFDSLPNRVDVAFDSAWKALELASTSVVTGNITTRLKLLASHIDAPISDLLCANIPVQSCEFIFKRLVSEGGEPGAESRPQKRAIDLGDDEILNLFAHLRNAYDSDDSGKRRKGALLLRRALRGEVLTLGEAHGVVLGSLSRARVLLSLFLYTARNDRFHGDSFSPFVSSAASLKTYTHPYFAFLASYYLLLATWLHASPEVIQGSRADLLASLQCNLDEAHQLFGRHWEQ